MRRPRLQFHGVRELQARVTDLQLARHSQGGAGQGQDRNHHQHSGEKRLVFFHDRYSFLCPGVTGTAYR